MNTDPLWYKDAVFYEVFVRAFADSNGDGIGDLAGLTAKLDYLQWLGVDAVWMLPIFPSPLRDDGYDVADYFAVHPDYGTLDDVRRLIEEAHRRDLRIIVELIPNHTSDQNAWFQASRDSEHPEHAKYRDWYVWSDTDQKYLDTRIIFLDTEPSNWTFDPLRGQYYWHRFFSHQPDLNYDNPDVQRAMLRVVQFWLDVGADAFRVDATPYLYEREGANGENLPETHALPQAAACVRGRVRARHDAPFRGQHVARGRAALPGRRSGRPQRARRRVPHELSFSAHAAHLHGAGAGGSDAHRADHRSHTAHPGQLPMGHLPPLPRRVDAGDGDARRAAVHVGLSTRRSRACG